MRRWGGIVNQVMTGMPASLLSAGILGKIPCDQTAAGPVNTGECSDNFWNRSVWKFSFVHLQRATVIWRPWHMQNITPPYIIDTVNRDGAVASAISVSGHLAQIETDARLLMHVNGCNSLNNSFWASAYGARFMDS